jgi:hypothetical protein
MKPRLAIVGTVGLLSLSLLGSLVLMSAAIQNSGRRRQWNWRDKHVVINVLGVE